MLRDEYSPAQQALLDEPVWPVLNREPARITAVPPVENAVPFRAAAGTPDVPVAVGVMLFGCYLALIGALALATVGSSHSKFMVVLAALFVVALFTVPGIVLAQDPKIGRRPSLQKFLSQGMDTFTGHCSGRAALVQILVVPVLLTLGVLGMAFEIAFLI